MVQTITHGYKALCHEAEQKIKRLMVDEVMAGKEKSEINLIDIRDIRELQRDGVIPGSFHAPRGMLEFWIDPESTYHKKIFAEDKAFVFMCAGGMRSLLATQLAQDMGLKPVYDMIGGFAAWRKAEGEIEPYGA